ncbi:MAG: cytochrome c [Nitrospirae bacterium]|nr:MAG: cytochrome c [Nitrospirota bacterium]
MKRLSFLSLTIGASILAGILIYLVGGTPDGEAIFKREGCIGCHSFKGRGGGAGPELTGVTERRSDSWIKKHIKDPKIHDPESRMPPFEHLSGKEIAALVRYLKD